MHLSWPSFFFFNAEESIIWRRQSELRAHIKLPDKTSIQKLRNQTTETIASLTEQGPYYIFDCKEFCTLRDALVYKLTLFNARTDEVASSMTLVGRMTRGLWSTSDRMFIVCHGELVKKLEMYLLNYFKGSFKMKWAFTYHIQCLTNILHQNLTIVFI